MNRINAILTATAEAVLAPFSSWPPVAVLILLSVVAGVVMTVVFRYTSNQRALKRVARRGKAQLLCLRIFKDDLGVALRCQGDLLKAIGVRLLHSMPPMAILIVPFVLVLTQLALRYENRPAGPGDSVITSLTLSPRDWKTYNDVSIEVPAGVTVETPPLRDQGNRTVYWRLRLETPTSEPLRWQVGSESIEKTFTGTEDPGRLCTVSARRPGRGFWDRLLRPGEPGFEADSAVQGIDVRYPRRSTPVFGLDVPWWLTFVVVSMITALCVRPFLRVQF